MIGNGVYQPEVQVFTKSGEKYRARQQSCGVDVPITKVDTLINFPSQSDLDDKPVCAIEFVSINEFTNSPISGNAAIPDAAAKRGVLNLKYDKCSVLENIPLYCMNVPFQQGRLYHVNNLLIKWTTCNVTFQATTGLATTQSIYFVVHYWDLYERCDN